MLDKLAKRLLQPVNTSVISILGVFNLLLGIWLILPFDSIDKQFAAKYLPEGALGGVILLIALLILIGSVREKMKILSQGTLLGFCFWFATTGVALYWQWQSPLWIFAFMIALYCGFINVNIRINTNLLNKKR